MTDSKLEAAFDQLRAHGRTLDDVLAVLQRSGRPEALRWARHNNGLDVPSSQLVVNAAARRGRGERTECGPAISNLSVANMAPPQDLQQVNGQTVPLQGPQQVDAQTVDPKSIPWEQAVSFEVAAGERLNGLAALRPGAKWAAVICHPHPQKGGDMNNAFVASASTQLQRAGISTLRFDFRSDYSMEPPELVEANAADVQAAIAWVRSKVRPRRDSLWAWIQSSLELRCLLHRPRRPAHRCYSSATRGVR